ncbi:MAG: DUF4157 domain-containing protein [Leptolyngbyaceae cyanobacterium SL_5_9]|nr:DUF4157 domain-containing protein [Leptolyngbyaceae cyanobacterium SL_5_9]NJO74378.1 DUF4157 domain-containing protein [Leptolyngbyaceae cyanobacterium RM1_406_9]
MPSSYTRYISEGKYNPETSSGKELLAHELTHVVQQNPVCSARHQGNS